MEDHLPYGITQCYLTTDTGERECGHLSGRPVLDLPTTEGWKAELIWVVDYIQRWFTCPQTVAHPITNRARCRATAFIETSV